VRLALATTAKVCRPTYLPLHLAEAELCGALGEYAAALSSAPRALALAISDELQTGARASNRGCRTGHSGKIRRSLTFLREALDDAAPSR